MGVMESKIFSCGGEVLSGFEADSLWLFFGDMSWEFPSPILFLVSFRSVQLLGRGTVLLGVQERGRGLAAVPTVSCGLSHERLMSSCVAIVISVPRFKVPDAQAWASRLLTCSST